MACELAVLRRSRGARLLTSFLLCCRRVAKCSEFRTDLEWQNLKGSGPAFIAKGIKALQPHRFKCRPTYITHCCCCTVNVYAMVLFLRWNQVPIPSSLRSRSQHKVYTIKKGRDGIGSNRRGNFCKWDLFACGRGSESIQFTYLQSTYLLTYNLLTFWIRGCLLRGHLDKTGFPQSHASSHATF